MLHSKPATSSAYNALPLINTNTITLTATDLAILGNIIRKHKMENHFGVHYLHRHFTIPDNHILASSTTETGIEIHVPLPYSTHPRYQGTHFLITSDGNFQPYEFQPKVLVDHNHDDWSSSPAVETFLKDFAATVLAANLQDKIALRLQQHDHSLQREITGEGWTLHYPCNMATGKCLDLASIPVGWMFEPGGEAGAKVVGIWTPSGANKDTGHNVTPTPAGSIEPLIDSPEMFVEKLREAKMVCCV